MGGKHLRNEKKTSYAGTRDVKSAAGIAGIFFGIDSGFSKGDFCDSSNLRFCSELPN